MSTESRRCVQVVNATETPHELVTRISTLRSRGPSNQSISGALNAYLDSHSLVINTGDLTGCAFITYLYSCDGWRGSVMNVQPVEWSVLCAVERSWPPVALLCRQLWGKPHINSVHSYLCAQSTFFTPRSICI